MKKRQRRQVDGNALSHEEILTKSRPFSKKKAAIVDRGLG